MKVYRDLTYITKRKRIATLSAISGVALLGAAFWLAAGSGQTGVIVAYVPLLIGTVVFHLGMQQVGKWNRAQRNDVILDGLLKELGERYALVHYAKIGKRVVEHSLVYPGGVIGIVARDLPGKVAYEQGRWRKVGQGISRFLGMGGAFLGNPTQDAASDTAALNQLLGDLELNQDADAVIAFLNPRIALDVHEPDFPVTNGEGLKPYLSSLPADARLKTADRDRIVEALIAEGNFETPQVVQKPRPVKRRVA